MEEACLLVTVMTRDSIMGKYNSGASTNLLHILMDFLFGGVAFLTVLICTGHLTDDNILSYVIASVMFTIIFLLSNKEARVYNVTTFFYMDRILRYITKSMLISVSITSTLLFYVSEADIDKYFYIFFLLSYYIAMIISALFVRLIIKRNKRTAPRVVLIGDIDRFHKFEHFLERSNIEANIIGYISMLPTDDERYLGDLMNLDYLIHKHVIDQVYFMHRHDDPIDVQPYIDLCTQMGITIRIIMNAYKSSAAQSYVSSVGTYPVLTYHTVTLNATSRAIKRVIDIIGSIIGIILTSIPMLLVALAVKLDSKGPVLFKQTRIGLNGRPFKIYKFRSMVANADAMKKDLMAQNESKSDLMFKMKNDPRITRVGKFIRKTSLDELPQFFNVLFGNMSLVGTRPPTLDEVKGYSHAHWRRMSIKPGITGMWQISGRSQITDFEEVVQLDTQYIDRWSVMLDFSIIFKTAVTLITRKGAC